MNMLQALGAPGRAPEIPAEADAYGWLVGSWVVDVVHYLADVRERMARHVDESDQRQRDELIGRRQGSDIVQIGAHADGTPIRWCFTAITGDSFRWTGDALEADGVTWKLEAEFHARRKG